jgi:hypothetical protein
MAGNCLNKQLDAHFNSICTYHNGRKSPRIVNPKELNIFPHIEFRLAIFEVTISGYGGRVMEAVDY